MKYLDNIKQEAHGPWLPALKPTWLLTKVPKLHIHSLSLNLFSPYGLSFLRYWTFFKIAIFGNETWALAKVPEGARIFSLNPRGVAIELIFDLWTAFSEIWPRPIFKITIFGFATWPLTKVPEVAHIPPILPLGLSPKFYSVLLYGWPFPRYWQFFIFPLTTMLNFNLQKNK